MRDLIFRIIHWGKMRKARRFIHSKEGEEWNKIMCKNCWKLTKEAKDETTK